MRTPNLDRYRIGGTQHKPELGIPLPRTPDGRVYRYSPNEGAFPRHFLIGDLVQGHETSPDATARMKVDPSSDQMVCPYSGVVDHRDAFTHPDDRVAAIETAKHAIVQDVRQAFHDMLKDATRGSKVLKLESSPPRKTPAPRFARRDLMRELVCDHCGRDYGVYAIALFCPCCGAPNLRLHFQRETELADAQVKLAESLGPQQEELAYRLLGNAHEDVLTAFEATLKAAYLYAVAQRPSGSAPIKPLGNDFQNIDRGKNRFAEVPLNPYSALEAEALAALALNIQMRHVIGHNLGVADAKFTQHATEARIGETIAIVGDDIRIFAGLCQAVIDEIDSWLAAGLVSPNANLWAQPPPRPSSPPPDPRLKALERLGLTPLAKKLGIWLAENSVDGLRGHVKGEYFTTAFGEVAKRELEEAIAELAADGYVTTTPFVGGALPRVRIAFELYSVFDPITSGHDPVTDSATLARLALEIGDGVRASALHEKSGWAVRRFNPALALLSTQLHSGWVSENDDQYAIAYFHLLPEDRVTLKRYIGRLAGGE